MSETFFSLNDLLRRKLQTGLVVGSIALCVASALFSFLFGDRLGLGILSISEARLTSGFASVFTHFVAFVEILLFIVGCVVVSFVVFLMMSQRIRDIGLMKGSGCPNDLVFGYFASELVIAALAGCSIGVILGVLVDLASAGFLTGAGFQISQKPVNLWLVLIVFVSFLALSLVLGIKPILDARKVEPVRAMSPTYYLGLGKEPGFKILSKSNVVIRIALRSLYRRKAATIRLALCFMVVFTLMAIVVAGGTIGGATAESWVEKAVGGDVIMIAHHDLCTRYKALLSSFYEPENRMAFDFMNDSYFVSESFLNALNSIPGVGGVDPRLITVANVTEYPGYLIDPETSATISVGDSRRVESLVIGVEPEKALSRWIIEGRFLKDDNTLEVMVGDSLAQKAFTSPLQQNLICFDTILEVNGICIDPINSGNVVYLPLKVMQDITGISRLNAVMLKLDPLSDRATALDLIRAETSAMSYDWEILELGEVSNKIISSLGYLWSTVMFLPTFSLAAVSLCMAGYVTLTMAEQRQEFGVLRALGAKPRTIMKIVLLQSLVVLLSSFAVGIAIGLMVTLLILVPEPVVTSFTIIEVAMWLLVVMVAISVLSFCLAARFSRKPIVDSLS